MNEKIAVSPFVRFFQWSLIALCITTIPFLTTFLYFGGNWYYPIIIFLELILFLFFIIKKQNISFLKKSDQTWLVVWMFPLIGFILYTLAHIHGDGEESRVLIAFVNKYVIFIIAVIAIRSCYINFVKQFLFVCYIMIILSIILFFLLISGIFSFTPELLEEVNEEFPRYNFILGTTNVWIKIGKTQIIRIAGWLEEPGALALLITYLLIINELLFQSKWQRILLHIGGLLTFSMAFIASILFLFPLWWKGPLITRRLYCYFKRKYLFYNIILIFIIVIALINIVQIFSMDFSFSDSKSALEFQLIHTIRRFSYDSEKGSFRGDNRFYIEYEINNIWFGDGEGVSSFTSPEAVIQRLGIIPATFCYIPIFFLIIQIITKIGIRKGKWLSAIILLNIVQRPAVNNLYIMILWTLIYISLDYDKYMKIIKE